MKRQLITITIESDAMNDIGQANLVTYFKGAFKPLAEAFNWSNGEMLFEPIDAKPPTLDDYLPPLN